MKAIDLVQKVTSLGLALRRGARAGGASDVPGGRTTEPLARRATVRLLQVTTLVATQMQKMPMPKPRPAERVALSVAASQLRALVGSALVREAAAGDRGSPEGALLELVHQTLALVDKALATDPELARDERRELPSDASAPSGARSEGTTPDTRQPDPRDVDGDHDAASTPTKKVTF